MAKIRKNAISPQSPDASCLENTWCWIKTDVTEVNVAKRKELDAAIFSRLSRIRTAQVLLFVLDSGRHHGQLFQGPELKKTTIFVPKALDRTI